MGSEKRGFFSPSGLSNSGYRSELLVVLKGLEDPVVSVRVRIFEHEGISLIDGAQ